MVGLKGKGVEEGTASGGKLRGGSDAGGGPGGGGVVVGVRCCVKGDVVGEE